MCTWLGCRCHGANKTKGNTRMETKAQAGLGTLGGQQVRVSKEGKREGRGRARQGKEAQLPVEQGQSHSQELEKGKERRRWEEAIQRQARKGKRHLPHTKTGGTQLQGQRSPC